MIQTNDASRCSCELATKVYVEVYVVIVRIKLISRKRPNTRTKVAIKESFQNALVSSPCQDYLGCQSPDDPATLNR